MFCPECKAEYVPGIVECADCHLPLVWVLPEEHSYQPEGAPVEWAPLLSTGSPADIALVKSLLEGEGILYWVQGENHGFAPVAGLAGAVVHVEKSRLEDARALVQDLNLNLLGFSTRTTDELD